MRFRLDLLAAMSAALLLLSPAFEAASAQAAQGSRAKVVKTGASAQKSAQTKKAPAKARPKPTPPPAKPDRSLYLSAKAAETRLRGSATLKRRLAEWEKVVSAYRVVVGRYPRSSYSDDALYNAGNLQREMARLFKNAKYADQALTSYGLVVSEYPGSRLGEPSLFASYEILTERKQTAGAKAMAEKYLAAYPRGANAQALGRALRTSTAERTASAAATQRRNPLPKGDARFERAGASSADHVQIYGIRFWSGETSTRVVVDLDRKVQIQQDRLQSPPRLFVDFIGTRLHPNLVDRTFPVGNAFLKQIRVGVNRENVVRVVIDFAEASSHNVFFLANPDRLVIDVKSDGRPGVQTASADPSTGATPLPAASPWAEVMENVQVTQHPPVVPEPTPTVAAPEPEVASTPTVVAAATPADPRPAPRKESSEPSTTASIPGPSPTPRPAIPPTPTPTPAIATTPPDRNRDGSYSLARQLGLGARRIALDAGHGGHDPGAIGRAGTQEKDLTLAIVLKLEKLLRTELGADVVLTRDSDVYIPLEERTAIANASGADLFLSVHINSARNPTGRGIETYYLSFAKSAAAEALAARENAISQATMKDLNNLVKAIATNSKIDESRDFAGLIQRSHIQGLSPHFPNVLDRGVHTAPFYVLIGANMPSILTEVGFISNAEEERRLRSEVYQQKIAEALLAGVRSYLAQLNRGQATTLGSRPGTRVPAKGRTRR